MKPIRWCLLVMAMLVAPAWAQPYPAKPVRIVVAFPPGGPTDVLARAIAQKLTDSLGHQVIVDNRPGATGTIGAALAAKAPPDGYTLIVHATSSYISAYLYRSATYDPVRDFAPIANVGTMPFYLVTHPSLPVKSVKDVIALAKRRPGDLAFSTPGAGSGGHLVMERLRAAAGGLALVHVPYKGAAPMITALMSGEVALAFDTISTSQPHVAAGRLRGIAVSSAKRVAAVPDVPTVMEAGIADFEAYLWFGLFAPAGTPAAVIDRLSQSTGRALSAPDYQSRMATLGAEAAPHAPDAFAQFLRRDVPHWVKVIRDTGARVD